MSLSSSDFYPFFCLRSISSFFFVQIFPKSTKKKRNALPFFLLLVFYGYKEIKTIGAPLGPPPSAEMGIVVGTHCARAARSLYISFYLQRPLPRTLLTTIKGAARSSTPNGGLLLLLLLALGRG
jgi:branched-subunit amino acid transport protein AzlD